MSDSPNRSSRAGWRPLAVVMHVTEGSGEGALAWLTNPSSKVSAHFLIMENGTVHQLVPLDAAAWANGGVHGAKWTGVVPGLNPNLYTISIEHAGFAAQAEWPDVQIDASARLLALLATQVDILKVVKHNEIYALKACPGTLPVKEIEIRARKYQMEDL